MEITIFIISNINTMKKRILILSFPVFFGSIAYSQGTWTQKANFGGGTITEERAFAIGNKGYFGAASPDLWEYDPVADTWTQKAAFTGPTRLSAAGFSIGTSGYFGTGGTFNDFYEYDQAGNAWTQKANFGGAGREGAAGCSINGKGYIGLGGNYLADWWEYDPVTNAWTQKANLGGPGRYHAGAFAIGSKGYVSCGFNGSFFNDLWEYDPVANAWTQKANLPGTTRDRPVGMSVGNKGYIVTGWTGTMALQDAWEWDQLTNTWTQLPDCPGAPRYNACGFSAVSKIYVGTGYANGPVNDFWEYAPSCAVQAASLMTSCNGSCDGSASVTFPDSNAVVSYLWSTTATTQSISGLCAGSYTVSVTDTAGCSSSIIVIVSEPAVITATFIDSVPACFGGSNGSLCALASGGTPPYIYIWSGTQTTSCIQNLSAGIYTAIITDSHGCTGSVSYNLTQPSQLQILFTPINATCQTCANGSITASNVTGGVSPYTYSWSNGGTTAFINNLLPGTYTCCVTDGLGCVFCDSAVVGYPTAIEDLNASEQISFAPNPFSDYFIIKTGNSEIDNFKIKWFDQEGRMMNVKTIAGKQTIRIDTRSLPEGIYFVQILLDDKIYYKKAIKSR
jgi:type IX secretion system substrate protein/SprB-like repeat protein/galactose oxidase-like protein/Kelch motif protein